MRRSLSKKVVITFFFIFFIGFSIFVSSCFEGTGKARRSSGIKIAESKTYEASLYRQNCAVCHGAEAYGKEINGQQVPSLRFGNAENKTEQELYEQIANGKHPMPSFKDQLTDEDIRRLVRFIRRDLQGKED
ncbi:MAG: cytochrome c [Acidobacteria bacterium]|jgi:cytochrome c553|nr:MAG: cytochrome c [Acidobacteriota bacterium]GIU82212.1 MAG: hypothetical protein KatS3mg006_1276 [Pyrinomonadaceae bacterium]